MFRYERGRIGARGNNLKLFAACVIERCARESCRQTLGFEFRRNFRVLNHHTTRQNLVNDESCESMHYRFKAARGFIVRYQSMVQIKLH